MAEPLYEVASQSFSDEQFVSFTEPWHCILKADSRYSAHRKNTKLTSTHTVTTVAFHSVFFSKPHYSVLSKIVSWSIFDLGSEK